MIRFMTVQNYSGITNVYGAYNNLSHNDIRSSPFALQISILDEYPNKRKTATKSK